MAVRYRTFDGKKVSGRWYVVLSAARKAGVRFTLTSGHRTLAEQWRLYRLWKAGRGNLAAFPSPNAPHIRTGRAAHAIDVNSLDGGEQRLENWLDTRIKGVGADNTVPGEAWHLELTGPELEALWRKYRPKPKPKKKPKKRKGPVMKPAKDRSISDQGVDLIATWEGFVPYAYNDAAGHATVGYGRLLHHGPVTQADRDKWGTKTNPKLTRARGCELLRDDIREKAANHVRRLVKVPVTQGQFDALVSLTFNIGAGAFASSTVLRQLNGKHYRAASLAFLMWTKAGGRVLLGLSRRRAAERRRFAA